MNALMRDVLVMVGSAMAGIGATLLGWTASASLVLPALPEPHRLLAAVVAGMAGPAALWLAVAAARSRPRTGALCRLATPASAGLTLVLAAEAAFYLPIGFLGVAFAIV